MARPRRPAAYFLNLRDPPDKKWWPNGGQLQFVNAVRGCLGLSPIDAAQAEFLAVMDEEEALRKETEAKQRAMRARFEETRKRKEEAFQAWEDELLKDPF